jgi:hypothetical protein
MIRVFHRTGLAVAAAGILIGCLGCEPAKPIRSYTVPKPEEVYKTNHLDPSVPKDTKGNPLPADDRMLAALIPHGGMAWFVKLSGPKDSVKPHAEAFQTLVKSIKFTANALPTWDAPANWKKTDGPPPRFATLTIGDTNPPLEVTVSPLQFAKDDDLISLTMRNVNRWRGQMSLRPIPERRLPNETQSLLLANGPAVYVDMLGKLQVASMPGVPPMAGHPPIASKTPPSEANEPTPNNFSAFKFETPAGWHPAENDVVSKMALETGEGAEKVRVTFSPMSAQGSELVPNVNRWRGQIELPNLDEKQLLANVDKMDIGGESGSYVELIGPQEAIFGAIVVRDNQGWFLKLRGPKAAAQAQQSNFRKLLKSIRFE